jgi:hypothetical protein
MEQFVDNFTFLVSKRHIRKRFWQMVYF